MEKKTDPLMVYVASKIETVLKEKNITQETLSLMTNLSRPSIVNMIHVRQNISLKNLYIISEALEIDPESLLPEMEWYKEYKGKKLKRVVSFIIDEH